MISEWRCNLRFLLAPNGGDTKRGNNSYVISSGLNWNACEDGNIDVS